MIPDKKLALGLTVLFLYACGYQLAKPPQYLSQNIQNLTIAKVENRTLEAGLEQIYTQSLIQTIKSYTNLNLTEKSIAQGILKAELVKLDYTPLGYDQFGRVNLLEINLSARLWLINAEDEKVIWSSGLMQVNEQYPVGDDFFSNYQLRRKALEEICSRLAKSQIELLLADF